MQKAQLLLRDQATFVSFEYVNMLSADLVYLSQTHKPHLAVACAVCEIIAFELNCDLETGVWVTQRSLKVAPLDRPTPKTQHQNQTSHRSQTGCEVTAIFVNPRKSHVTRQPPSWILSNRKQRHSICRRLVTLAQNRTWSESDAPFV